MTFDLDPKNMVLFVDFDDTLIEPQSDPTAFEIPEDLRTVALSLSKKPWPRVTIVTGRSVSQIDSFFHPIRFSVIGCHGCELRIDTDRPPIGLYPEIPPDLRARILSIIKRYPEHLTEDKKYTMTIHQRSESLPSLYEELDDAILAQKNAYALLHYGSCLEIKPASTTKGDSLAKVLSEEACFSGLRPVYIGDDVGKDKSLEIIRQFNGILIPVGSQHAYCDFGLINPAEVRRFLGTLNC
jgi:trehalose 6-phosphate phosphatase